MSSKRLKALARILVMGSVTCDEVIKLREPLQLGGYCTGTNLGSRLGGGAANTAIALAAAGHKVALLSTVGNDAIGNSLISDLTIAGVDISLINRISKPSTRSLLLLDKFGERTVINITLCDEDYPPERLLSFSADIVYVRSRRLDIAPILKAKAKKSLIIAHLPPNKPGVRPAHILVASRSDLGRKISQLIDNLGYTVSDGLSRWVIITDGAAGACLYSLGNIVKVPAKSVKVVDTTGAGDAFTAGLIHAITKNSSVEDILTTAVKFGTEATLWSTSNLPKIAVRKLLKLL